MSGRDTLRAALAIALMLAAAGAAHAQTPAAPAPAAPDRGYAEVIAESAFGNVTTQAFAGEIGVTVKPAIQVFGSFGVIRDVSTAEIGCK